MPIKGMMNSEKYTDVLKKIMTPKMARKFPEDLGVFQEDLAPCHTSRKVYNGFALNSISFFDWPEYYPDLSSI